MNMHSSRCHFSHCLFVVFQLYQRQCRALCNGPQKSQVCHEDIPSSNLQMQLPKALAVTHVPLVLHQWHPCQRKSGQLPLHVLFQLTWRSPLTHSFLSTHFLWCCVDGWGIAAAKVYPHQLQSFHGSIGGKQSVDQQTTWYGMQHLYVYRIACVGVFIVRLGGKYSHKPKACEMQPTCQLLTQLVPSNWELILQSIHPPRFELLSWYLYKSSVLFLCHPIYGPFGLCDILATMMCFN